MTFKKVPLVWGPDIFNGCTGGKRVFPGCFSFGGSVAYPSVVDKTRIYPFTDTFLPDAVCEVMLLSRKLTLILVVTA